MTPQVNTLDIKKIFRYEAENIVKAREMAHLIHKTKDIKAAGAEIEKTVRKFFRRMLPSRFHVTQRKFRDRQKAPIKTGRR
jgi:hypothetical protein